MMRGSSTSTSTEVLKTWWLCPRQLLSDQHNAVKSSAHDCKTNEHNAAQNARFLISWIVKQEACSTPIGAFLQYRTQACNILEP